MQSSSTSSRFYVSQWHDSSLNLARLKVVTGPVLMETIEIVQAD